MNRAAAFAVATLRETATPDRVGERAVRRLADVQQLFGDDMAWVDRELRAAASKGLSPATESATHLLDAGGKRVRPLALLLSAACFAPISDAARELAVVAELVHLATLLHDDVVDDGQERRGRPTSRRLWGNAVSVLAGDLLLTHALERTSEVGNREALSDLFATLRRLVDGEVIQLRGRTRIDVTEATYFQIVQDKTASLFAWAGRTGARIAGAPASAVQAMGEFGAHLGVAFQLVDDVLDYAGDPQATGKALFVDLSEGKVTLPLLRAMAARPSLAADLEAVRAGDDTAAARLAVAIRELNVCDSVRALAHAETARAVEALSWAPQGAPRDLLAGVATDLVARLG